MFKAMLEMCTIQQDSWTFQRWKELDVTIAAAFHFISNVKSEGKG